MECLELKKMVVEANKELPKQHLVKYSWGNVSAIDRENKLIVIKPVGLPYNELTVNNVSVVDLEGNIIEGPYNPSVDLDIHRALYENFTEVQAIVHTHSTFATILAQLGKPLPCYGTTHADYFGGDIPCVEQLTEEEVNGSYEWNTGMAIVRYFKKHGIKPLAIPGVLSPSHGPFTWGIDVWDAVHKAVVLEEIAKMAVHMYSICPDPAKLPEYMLNRHYYRKHGPNAYFTNDDYGAGMIQREKK